MCDTLWLARLLAYLPTYLPAYLGLTTPPINEDDHRGGRDGADGGEQPAKPLDRSPSVPTQQVVGHLVQGGVVTSKKVPTGHLVLGW